MDEAVDQATPTASNGQQQPESATKDDDGEEDSNQEARDPRPTSNGGRNASDKVEPADTLPSTTRVPSTTGSSLARTGSSNSPPAGPTLLASNESDRPLL
jgi:hypothetical protein